MKKAGAKEPTQFEKDDYARMMKLATSTDPKEREQYRKEIESNRKKNLGIIN